MNYPTEGQKYLIFEDIKIFGYLESKIWYLFSYDFFLYVCLLIFLYFRATF